MGMIFLVINLVTIKNTPIYCVWTQVSIKAIIKVIK